MVASFPSATTLGGTWIALAVVIEASGGEVLTIQAFALCAG
jgi:hypothetical protein